MRASHRRANDQTVSSQWITLNYIRFFLAGDLAGAWAAFGGLTPQLAHLGTLLSIASTANGPTAMAYGRSVRATVETHSRKRTSGDMTTKMFKMLTEEHDVPKNAILRELAVDTVEKKRGKVSLKTNGKGDPPRRTYFPKEEGKGKGKGKGQWPQWNSPWRNDRHAPKGKGKQKGQRQNWRHNGWNQWANHWESGKTKVRAGTEAKALETTDSTKATEKVEK